MPLGAPVTSAAELSEPIAALATLELSDPMWAAHLTLALRALAARLDRIEAELVELKERGA